MNIEVILILFIVIIVCIFFYIVYFKETFTQEDIEYVNGLVNELSTIFPNIRNINVIPSTESATINKRTVRLCIKDKRTGVYYPKDVILYVLIHEYAHVISQSYSTKYHNKEFKENLNNLLEKAYNSGIINIVPIPKNYCS